MACRRHGDEISWKKLRADAVVKTVHRKVLAIEGEDFADALPLGNTY